MQKADSDVKCLGGSLAHPVSETYQHSAEWHALHGLMMQIQQLQRDVHVLLR